MFKSILKITLLGLGGLLVICAVIVASAIVYERNAEPIFVSQDTEFKNELNIPPLLEPTEHDGQKVFNITLQKGETEFFEGTKTDTWGANGAYLMPTLRASEGDDVEMHVINELGERTTLHWHGMHLPAIMDGVHQMIEPKETWKPYWKIKQQAATLWYHPHLMGQTGQHVYNGLAGMFILEDENSENLDIPKEYGVDDLPLIVQDREFDEDGQLVYRSSDSDIYGHTGMLGDTIIVNGTRAPFVEVPGKMVRFRILNGSNARRYNFGFSDNREFYQIASDGGFLERPVPRKRMMLAVGERAEILVDMSSLENVTLMSYEIIGEKPTLQKFVERILNAQRDEGEIFKIIELRPQVTKKAEIKLPQTLNAIQRWNEAEAARTRNFTLGNNRINGEKMEIDRIDEVVQLGTKEIWKISNPSGSHHPFHVHDVQFLILDRNGEAPPEYEQGWKDTVLVDKDETVRVIMEFKDYADPNVAYMFHCHILEHEDHGMMGQFVVVDQDTKDEDIYIKSDLRVHEETHNH